MVSILVAITILLCGFAMFTYYDLTGCDPLRGGLISNQNQVSTITSHIHLFKVTILTVNSLRVNDNSLYTKPLCHPFYQREQRNKEQG